MSGIFFKEATISEQAFARIIPGVKNKILAEKIMREYVFLTLEAEVDFFWLFSSRLFLSREIKDSKESNF
jgi:hypothetical protein